MIKRLLVVILFIINISIIGYGQSSSQSTRRIWSGTSLPSVCQPTGTNIFYKSDTGVLYSCTATNTWTAIGSPAGAVTTAGGTANTIAKFTSSTVIGNSSVTDDGTNVSSSANVIPTTDNTKTLGSSSKQWSNIWTAGQVKFNGASGDGIGYTTSVGPKFLDGTVGFMLGFNLQSLTTDRVVIWPNAAGTILLTSTASGNYVSSIAGTANQITASSSTGAITLSLPTALTGIQSITGVAGNMTIIAGTGNSRTMILQTTTSGGVATTALTLGADQSATLGGSTGTIDTSGTSLNLKVNGTSILNYNFSNSNTLTGLVSTAINPTDSGTTNALDIITLNHGSSAAAAANFGGSLLYQGKSSTTSSRDMAKITALWTTATDASRTADIVFYNVNNAASLTETFRITAVGSVVVAGTTDSTTTTSGALQVAGGAAIRKRVFIDGITTSSGLQTAVLCQSSGGEMIADSVACLASSGRFKENIKPLISGLDEVMKLRPVSYYYKPEGIFAKNLNFQRERVGFIAEDIANVDARFVGYEADGITPRTVSYEMIVPLLVKSIQELELKIERLEHNQQKQH